MKDALWIGYERCLPSNNAYDNHRPLGVTRISALYLSHESVYLLGNTSIPETPKENKWVMAARTNYLNENMIEQVLYYSQDFNLEVGYWGLLKKMDGSCRMVW